jgi:hypothetical protein
VGVGIVGIVPIVPIVPIVLVRDIEEGGTLTVRVWATEAPRSGIGLQAH